MLGSWKEAITAINRGGVCLSFPDGRQSRSIVRAVSRPEECPDADLTLVLVKAWQTETIAQQLLRIPALHGPVITLQNGLGNREILSDYLGPNRVVLGVTTFGATLLSPGVARYGGQGVISLENQLGMQAIQAYFSSAGLSTEIVDDATSLVWGKLVVSAAINPLTALLQVQNGVLLERPSARLLLRALAAETAAVGIKMGAIFPFEDPVSAVEAVTRRTSTNFSSMLQDVRRGAPTEIDAISGAIVRLGHTFGLPVMLNQNMWQLVSALRS